LRYFYPVFSKTISTSHFNDLDPIAAQRRCLHPRRAAEVFFRFSPLWLQLLYDFPSPVVLLGSRSVETPPLMWFLSPGLRHKSRPRPWFFFYFLYMRRGVSSFAVPRNAPYLLLPVFLTFPPPLAPMGGSVIHHVVGPTIKPCHLLTSVFDPFALWNFPPYGKSSPLPPLFTPLQFHPDGHKGSVHASFFLRLQYLEPLTTHSGPR